MRGSKKRMAGSQAIEAAALAIDALRGYRLGDLVKVLAEPVRYVAATTPGVFAARIQPGQSFLGRIGIVKAFKPGGVVVSFVVGYREEQQAEFSPESLAFVQGYQFAGTR